MKRLKTSDEASDVSFEHFKSCEINLFIVDEVENKKIIS